MLFDINDKDLPEIFQITWILCEWALSLDFGALSSDVCAHRQSGGFANEGELAEAVVAHALLLDRSATYLGGAEEFVAEVPVTEEGGRAESEGCAAGTDALYDEACVAAFEAEVGRLAQELLEALYLRAEDGGFLCEVALHQFVLLAGKVGIDKREVRAVETRARAAHSDAPHAALPRQHSAEESRLFVRPL